MKPETITPQAESECEICSEAYGMGTERARSDETYRCDTGRAGGWHALALESRGRPIPSPYNGSLENQLTEYHAAELQRVAYRLALAGKPGWQRLVWDLCGHRNFRIESQDIPSLIRWAREGAETLDTKKGREMQQLYLDASDAARRGREGWEDEVKRKGEAQGLGETAIQKIISKARAATRAAPVTASALVTGPDNGTVVLVSAASVKPIKTKWVIPFWLPRGKLSLLAGQAGQGKTTLALYIAALVSTGGTFPSGKQATKGRVVIWSGEDERADTLVPRLTANGADLDKVSFLTGTHETGIKMPFDPASHMPQVVETLKRYPDTRLLILDPIIAVAAEARDGYRANDIRKALEPVVALAQSLDVAVLGVHHFLKRHGAVTSDPLDRVLGSQAWGAVARMVMVVDSISTGRALMRAKSNLGPTAGGYGYTLEDTPIGTDGITGLIVRFGETIEGEAVDAFRQKQSRGEDEDRHKAVSAAKDWLLGELEVAGKLTWAEIVKAGKITGYTEHTLRLARDDAKAASEIVSERTKNLVSWKLPGPVE